MRPVLEGRLPGWLTVRWWDTPYTLVSLAPHAEIGWFDLHEKSPVLAAVQGARALRWLNTAYAGVDWLPLAELERRGIVLTGGSGLTSGQVAEWAMLGMLSVAKRYREVVRAQDRGEWLHPAPAGPREVHQHRV